MSRLEQALHLIKGFSVNYGLVGIFYDKPFFLRHPLLDMDFIAFHPLTSLHHIPHIDTVFQDRVYGNACSHIGLFWALGALYLSPCCFL